MGDSESRLTLDLSGIDLEEEAIDRQTRAMRRMLQENLTEGEVLEPEAAGIVPGAKGDPITIGTIVIALITSGAVASLIDCCRAVFVREKELRISVKTTDGRQIDIDAKNVHDEKTVKLLEGLLTE
jgi:hypothetical protein